MPLPNLSGKSFMSTSPTFDSYQSGADSYREKVREKLQNSPRSNNNANSYEYSRSIDLSLNRDNSFRPISRHSSVNNNNNNRNGENSNVRLKSAVSDNNNNYSRLKSGRRQIVIYNNNNNGIKNDNEDPEFTDNSNIDMRKEMHRRNNTRNRNFNTSPIISDEDFSLNTDRNEGVVSRHQRSQRVEDSFFENSNDNIIKHQQPILSNQTKENLLKAPLITPRKSLQQSNNNSKSNLFMNKTSNENLDEFSSTSNKRYNNNKNSENNENEFIPNNFEQNKLNKLRSPRNFDMVTSRTSFRDDDDDNQTSPPQSSTSQPPVPVPRKRDPNANLLNNNFNNHINTNLNSENAEIRIKRNSSASINKTQGYMPTPRSDQIISQSEPNNRKIELSNQYVNLKSESNVPIIKGNTREDGRNISLLNGRRSGFKLRNSDAPSLEKKNDNYFLNDRNMNSRRN